MDASMAMNIQERQLIADIRRLNPAGQDELLQQLDRIKRNSPVKKAQQPSQRISASLPQKMKSDRKLPMNPFSQNKVSYNCRTLEALLQGMVARLLLAAILIWLTTLTAAAAETLPPLVSPPLGERWFSISMNGERVGFLHTNATRTSEGLELVCEGGAKMLVLGFSREASARERYILNRDLTIRSFSIEQFIDKSPLNLRGIVSGRTLTVTVETAGGKKETKLKLKGAVYPPAAINLYPLMQGFSAGKKYRLQVFDIEAVKIKEVTVKAIGIDHRSSEEVLRMQNDLYTFVDNDIWVRRTGEILEESVRDGLIVTRAESAEQARRYMLEDAVAKKDMVLDFSLVRVNREIPRPDELKRLVIDLAGYPQQAVLPAAPGQTAQRTAPDTVRLTISAPLQDHEPAPLDADARSNYLAPTPRLNSDSPEIVARQKDILAGSESERQSVEKLVSWVAAHLNDTVTDSHSALEALQKKQGNCQSHARLYVALARAAGIPSRFVSGLVYAQGKGFLYHSWAESHVNGSWLALDPTFDQVPADATHIRLVEGDEANDLAPLVGIIGRIKGTIIELQ